MSVSQTCENIMSVLRTYLCTQNDTIGLKQMERLAGTMQHISPELEEELSLFASTILTKDHKQMVKALEAIESLHRDEIGDRVMIVLQRISDKFI